MINVTNHNQYVILSRFVEIYDTWVAFQKLPFASNVNKTLLQLDCDDVILYSPTGSCISTRLKINIHTFFFISTNAEHTIIIITHQSFNRDFQNKVYGNVFKIATEVIRPIRSNLPFTYFYCRPTGKIRIKFWKVFLT